MQRGLTAVAVARRNDARRRRDESIRAWTDQSVAWIELVRAQWVGKGHTEQELVELQRELETVLSPLRKEFLVRQGQFREFLKKTMPEKIRALVMRAKDSESSLSRWLKSGAGHMDSSAGCRRTSGSGAVSVRISATSR